MEDNLLLLSHDEECACDIDEAGIELVCAYHEDLYACEDSLANTYEPIMLEA